MTPISLKPSRLTRGLKSKLNAQVDYINANYNRGMFQESISMIDVMIHNLNYLSKGIQKHKGYQEKHEAMKQRQQEVLDSIDKRTCTLCKCHSLNLNEIRDPCGCKCHGVL